jgi:hypothetical protein
LGVDKYNQPFLLEIQGKFNHISIISPQPVVHSLPSSKTASPKPRAAKKKEKIKIKEPQLVATRQG